MMTNGLTTMHRNRQEKDEREAQEAKRAAMSQ